MLSAENLAIIRGERLVFKGLGLAARPGEAIVLRGPNGAGKSTLLRLLAGLLRPAVGHVAWGGQDIAGDALAHGARLRYLGHGDAVKNALRVWDNLAFWAGLDGVLTNRAVNEALDRVGLGRLAGVPAAALSAGQRRRLNLARLLLAPRPLWLLDEPTTALDAASVTRLAELVSEHRAAGGIVIAATHDDFAPADARILSLTLALTLGGTGVLGSAGKGGGGGTP